MWSDHHHPPSTSRFPARCVSGEKGTLSHGSIVEGRFEGFIKTLHGMYYVEPSERYLKHQDVPYHSVIYHEDDVRKSLLHCYRVHRTFYIAALFDSFFFSPLICVWV